ncbi:hypothetical protein ACFXJ8_18690 [Nonomuraea sp. NPDC059194]|uniref:hypothetical protein n=1 Tax=Nonomuraea sp. NPDC059194 TaxID=3346764 RepID=UPI00368114A4
MSDQQPDPYGTSDPYGLRYPSGSYDSPSSAPIPYGQQIPGPFGHPAVPHTRQRLPVRRPPRKEPASSVVLSFFLPGVGSIVNGDTGKGVGILVGSYAAMFVGVMLTFVIVGFLILPVAFGLWVWGLIDAYQGAVQANQRNGYPG